MKTKTEELREERARLVKSAQRVVDEAKSGDRDLTTAEVAQVDRDLDRVKEIDAHLTAAAKNDAMWSRFGSGASSASASYGWAKSVADRLGDSATSMGTKALLTGQVSTPPAVEVVDLPETPRRLLDLIPRAELHEHTFAYLRQTVATNNAAPVADNAEKPTSVYTFSEVEDRARVIAHLSEPFPIRYAEDHASMIEVLQAQMVGGVWSAIEELIVSGTGVGEQWTGILNVDGTTEVAFDTDTITTLRKARTTLEVKGERVTGVAMNPADVQALDLTREDGATGGFLLDGSAYERIFGPGVSGIPSTAVPQGTAIVGDWSRTRLLVRQGVHTLAATQSGDLFDKNQMKFRTEGRYGFQVLRPQALALVALAEGGAESSSA